jgi:hypothetical protein
MVAISSAQECGYDRDIGKWLLLTDKHARNPFFHYAMVYFTYLFKQFFSVLLFIWY